MRSSPGPCLHFFGPSPPSPKVEALFDVLLQVFTSGIHLLTGNRMASPCSGFHGTSEVYCTVKFQIFLLPQYPDKQAISTLSWPPGWCDKAGPCHEPPLPSPDWDLVTFKRSTDISSYPLLVAPPLPPLKPLCLSSLSLLPPTGSATAWVPLSWGPCLW